MTDELVQVELEHANGVLVVRLTGEIDLSNVDQLQQRLTVLVAPGQDLTLDLTGIEYIDSQGLRLLVQLHENHVSSGSKLQVVAPPGGFTREVLEMTSIDEDIAVLDAPNPS
jgi:anti-sigma B factor antagonist